MAYVYMECLDQQAYENVFKDLNTIIGSPGLQIQKCHIDFEYASANALKASDKDLNFN